MGTTTTDYGRDLSCVSDLDASMSEVSGRMCLAQSLARRITSPRGAVIDDPNACSDIRDFLNDDISTADLARFTAMVDAEFRKDERVISSTSTLIFVDSTVTVSSSIVDGDGPFRLVLAISDVTTAILKVGS